MLLTCGVHVVGRLDDLGVRFVGPLRQHHLHKLGHHVHVRVLQIPLLQRSQALGPAGIAQHRVAGAERGLQQVRAHALQAAGVGKRGQLNLPQLRWILLSRKGRIHHSVLGNGDRGGIGRNRDGRNQRVAVGGHNRSLVVQVKLPGAGVGDGAVRPLYLKESRALNRHIQRVVGLVQLALRVDDLGRRRLGAKADLQSGRDRVLALGRARRHEVLIHHVLKLQAQLAKTRGRRVGQIVGDRIQVQLLRAHAAGCGVQSSNHVSPPLTFLAGFYARPELDSRQILAWQTC